MADYQSARILVCLAGILVATPAHAFLDQLLKPLAEMAIQNQVQSPTQLPAAIAPAAPPAQLPSPVCTSSKPVKGQRPSVKCGPATPLAVTRSPSEFDALLAGQEISGDQLLTEIRSLQSAVATHNLNQAMGAMMGSMTPQNMPTGTSTLGGFGGGAGFFGSIFSFASDAVLDMLVSELSYQALDHFFALMTDKPGLLKDVTVTMPKADATTPPEIKQQLVNMAGFLVAIKASGKIIDSSDKDFEASKESYRKVLDARMAATKLLGDTFLARSGLEKSQELDRNYLTAEQHAFLTNMSDMKAEDFMKNFAAQNIALEYQRKKDPNAYKDYSGSLGEFKSHYGAYTRTSVGAASMLGFSALFLKRAKNMLEKNGLAAAPLLLPMITTGLTETVSLAPRVTKVFDRSPDLQNGSFFVRNPKGETQRELTAGKAFTQLGDDSRAVFRMALFKEGGLGYFGIFGEKSPLASGRVLDSLVQKDNRNKLTKGFFERDEWPDFSFQNVLTGIGQDVDARQLRQFRNDLFRSAPAMDVPNADQQAIALVQQDVREKLEKWDNATLRQIIFSNRGQTQPGVELAVNGYMMGVDSPGMMGIMEYEAMAAVGAEHATTRTNNSDREPATPPPKSKGKSKVQTKPKATEKTKS